MDVRLPRQIRAKARNVSSKRRKSVTAPWISVLRRVSAVGLQSRCCFRDAVLCCAVRLMKQRRAGPYQLGVYLGVC
jgi:hypothetical protein